MNKLNVLTAAHIGFLHSPDVGATQVTGLHNADLVRAEPVIQRTSELLRTRADSVKPCMNANNLNEGRGIQLTHLSFFFLFFVVLVAWMDPELRNEDLILYIILTKAANYNGSLEIYLGWLRFQSLQLASNKAVQHRLKQVDHQRDFRFTLGPC